MGRTPCCSKEGLNKGAWTALEDKILSDFISKQGQGRWRKVAKETGLKRCGKSCRLRWLNYLRPDIKRGDISPEEEDLVIRLHRLLGNRWALIAGRLPGRTDNEIKNYWNTTIRKKVMTAEKSSQTEDVKKKLKTSKPTIKTMPSSIMVESTHVMQTNTTPSCRKDFVVAQAHKVDDFLTTSVAEEEEDSALKSKDGNSNLEEVSIADFCDSYLWKLCQFDNVGIEEDCKFNVGIDDHPYAWPSAEHPLFFSHSQEMMLNDWTWNNS